MPAQPEGTRSAPGGSRRAILSTRSAVAGRRRAFWSARSAVLGTLAPSESTRSALVGSRGAFWSTESAVLGAGTAGCTPVGEGLRGKVALVAAVKRASPRAVRGEEWRMFHVKHPRSYAASRGANGGVAPPRRRRGKSQAVRERALRRREERRACVAAWSRRLGSRKSSRTKRVGTVRSTLGSRGCPWQPKRHPRAQTEGAGRSGAEGPRRPRTARVTLGPRRKGGRAQAEGRKQGPPRRPRNGWATSGSDGAGGDGRGPSLGSGRRGVTRRRWRSAAVRDGVGHHWAQTEGVTRRRAGFAAV